jgi:hypothetical protein
MVFLVMESEICFNSSSWSGYGRCARDSVEISQKCRFEPARGTPTIDARMATRIIFLRDVPLSDSARFAGSREIYKKGSLGTKSGSFCESLCRYLREHQMSVRVMVSDGERTAMPRHTQGYKSCSWRLTWPIASISLMTGGQRWEIADPLHF